MKTTIHNEGYLFLKEHLESAVQSLPTNYILAIRYKDQESRDDVIMDIVKQDRKRDLYGLTERGRAWKSGITLMDTVNLAVERIKHPKNIVSTFVEYTSESDPTRKTCNFLLHDKLFVNPLILTMSQRVRISDAKAKLFAVVSQLRVKLLCADYRQYKQIESSMNKTVYDDVMLVLFLLKTQYLYDGNVSFKDAIVKNVDLYRDYKTAIDNGDSTTASRIKTQLAFQKKQYTAIYRIDNDFWNKCEIESARGIRSLIEKYTLAKNEYLSAVRDMLKSKKRYSEAIMTDFFIELGRDFKEHPSVVYDFLNQVSHDMKNTISKGQTLQMTRKKPP